MHLKDPHAHWDMIEGLESRYKVEECSFNTIFGSFQGYKIYASREVAEKIEKQTRYAAELYNVDVRQDQRYMAEKDLFPCGDGDESRFIYPEEVRMVCEAFSIDSVASVAEGSLIITVRPGYSSNILESLGRSGIKASVIGLVTGDPDTKIMKRRDGSIDPLKVPAQDPFWPGVLQGISEVII